MTLSVAKGIGSSGNLIIYTHGLGLSYFIPCRKYARNLSCFVYVFLVSVKEHTPTIIYIYYERIRKKSDLGSPKISILGPGSSTLMMQTSVIYMQRNADTKVAKCRGHKGN